MRALFAVLALVLLAPLAHGENKFTRASAGATHIEKGVPYQVDANRAAFAFAGGLQLSPTTAALVRLDGFQFDGFEMQASLAVELDLFAYGGLMGAAGIAGNELSRLGSVLTVGAFGRVPLSRDVRLHLEATRQETKRSDFGGTRMGMLAGVEVTWP